MGGAVGLSVSHDNAPLLLHCTRYELDDVGPLFGGWYYDGRRDEGRVFAVLLLKFAVTDVTGGDLWQPTGKGQVFTGLKSG